MTVEKQTRFDRPIRVTITEIYLLDEETWKGIVLGNDSIFDSADAETRTVEVENE